MMEVVRDVHAETGHVVGIKACGGHSRVEAGGPVPRHPLRDPSGPVDDARPLPPASSLLNDVLMQVRKERTGRYQSGDYFTID